MTHVRTRLRNLDESRAVLAKKQKALDTEVGKHLRQLRLDHRLTLKTVSKSAGVSLKSLWEIEQGFYPSEMTLQLYDKVAKAIKLVASAE